MPLSLNSLSNQLKKLISRIVELTPAELFIEQMQLALINDEESNPVAFIREWILEIISNISTLKLLMVKAFKSGTPSEISYIA